jgi:anaerobic magnesium-protoporphyrin IX monomethyl ester cyclase
LRIAFVEDVIRFSIPLGITGIAAILRRSGHDCALFMIGDSADTTIERIRAYGPEAVAFSVISGSHQGYYAFARLVKERLGIPTIWGGPHPTFFPEMIELDWVDAVCIGEGEEAALRFADAFDAGGRKFPTDVPNFTVKRDGQVFANPVLPRNRHLDDLPYPARDLYYDQFPILREHGIKHFMAHRGCPYKCTYCFNDSYNNLYREQAGDLKVFSSRTPESICDEILDLREKVPVRMVAFVDDVFTLHRRWTLEFAAVYAKRCRIPFSFNTRFDNVDAEVVEALAEAGLSLVYAGVESGDEHIRNVVMKRKMTEESMVETAALYRKHKIKLLTENVIGCPGETFESAMRTLRVNMKIKPNIANASVFAPYPKLEMTRYAIEKGYFDGDFDRLNSNYYHDSVLKFDDPSDKNRILNLRCFFSVLAHHPWLMPVVRPLLEMKPNALFRWVGDLADGYYLKRCVAYKFTMKDFVTTLKHFLGSYRRGSPAGRTAEAKQPAVAASAGASQDRTQSPYCKS